MTRYLIFVIATLFSLSAHAVDMSIITETGYVGFSVPDDWLVIGMQTKPPVSVAAFQIVNAADKDTPDSTNLLITLFQPSSQQALQALEKVGRQYGPTPPAVEPFKNWTIYRQEANQGKTVYSIFDAKSNVADVIVSVRIAWPHLPNNDAAYDVQMESAFKAVVESIHGGIGTYPPKDGEVIRRQAQ